MTLDCFLLRSSSTIVGIVIVFLLLLLFLNHPEVHVTSLLCNECTRPTLLNTNLTQHPGLNRWSPSLPPGLTGSLSVITAQLRQLLFIIYKSIYIE